MPELLTEKDKAYILNHPEMSAKDMGEELGISPGTVHRVRDDAKPPPPSPIEGDRDFFAVAVLATLAQMIRIGESPTIKDIAKCVESSENGVRNVLGDARRHGLLDDDLNFLTGKYEAL